MPVELTEAEFQAHILSVLKLLGYVTYHTHDSRRSESGFPDIIAIKPPVLIAAELKRNKTVKPTGEQLRWLGLFNKCDDVRGVVWTPEDRDAIYRDLSRISHYIDTQLTGEQHRWRT